MDIFRSKLMLVSACIYSLVGGVIFIAFAREGSITSGSRPATSSPTTTTSSPTTSSPATASIYRIEFKGESGINIDGGVVWVDPNNRDNKVTQQVNATLPHTIYLDTPDGAIVAAGAKSTVDRSNVEPVTVEIYYKGVRCDRDDTQVVNEGVLIRRCIPSS